MAAPMAGQVRACSSNRKPFKEKSCGTTAFLNFATRSQVGARPDIRWLAGDIVGTASRRAWRTFDVLQVGKNGRRLRQAARRRCQNSAT